MGLALGLILLLVSSPAAHGASPSPSPAPTTAPPVELTAEQPRVALTFDDLPVHGALPPGKTRVDIARSIVETLQSRHAPPTYGFINAKGLEEAPENADVLRLWRAAGYPLGNHGFSHMDLHANPAEAFEQDVLANEQALKAAMGGEDWHWLRFPYLREGDTIEKRRGVGQFLKEHGYKVAEVTLSFDDYAYNEPYARCLTTNDLAAIEWMKESYLARASESLTAGQEAARRIYGHDIPHVMLLHVGGFQMVMLPRLLDLLEQRGVKLVTLQDAQSDPAYGIDPDLPSRSGATLLEQMMAARNIPPAPRPPDPFARLAGLCR